MAKVYSIGVALYATAVIKADSEAHALRIARKLKGRALIANMAIDGGATLTSGLNYDNPDLPDVSLSPAVTIGGLEFDDMAGPAPELVHEDLIASNEEPVRVEDLKGGMMCDLEGDMYADNAGRYPEFEFAYAVVVDVQVNPAGEPPGTVIVEFDKITVAFPIGHTLPTIKDPQ